MNAKANSGAPNKPGTKPTKSSPALFAGLAVAVAALGVAVFVISGGGSDEPDEPAVAAPAGVQAFDDLSNDHVEGHVDYPQTPPVGGPHAPPPHWQNCGFYSRPVPEEQAVHSMEHGAVWITYRPDLASLEVDALQQLAAEHEYALVSPYPDLPAPVVASAWGRQLQLDSATDARLEQFLDAFEEGDQAPEPGAPCTDGDGSPE